MTKVPCDKFAHFTLGALIFALSYPLSGWYALLTVALVAVVKEVYDRYTPNHTSDYKDAIATVMGALVVSIPVYLGVL